MSRKLPKLSKLPASPAPLEAKRPEDMSVTELQALAYQCGKMAELWAARYQRAEALLLAKQEPQPS